MRQPLAWSEAERESAGRGVGQRLNRTTFLASITYNELCRTGDTLSQKQLDLLCLPLREGAEFGISIQQAFR